MNAQITFSQLMANNSLMNFFFRKQAQKQLDELLNSVQESSEDVFTSMEAYSDDLDEIEDVLYNESIEDIIEIFGLTKDRYKYYR